MITNSIKHILRAGLVGCGLTAALLSCTDTWDDHYDGTISGVNEGSLWDAIRTNPELSNFASVVEATGYDKSLGSAQVFTVFAPTNANLSAQQASDLIADYRMQKQSVSDEDNTVIKEFVQNHISLYNHSVSPVSNDSIVLMNGKFAVLRADKIDNSSFQSANTVYQNGILYTLDKTIDYAPNVFEYLRKDPELDSLRQFFFNPWYYRKEFSASQSVEGGIDDDGNTVYLDSVFTQRNELYNVLGRVGSEDSTYWMLAPTNEVWTQLVEKYTPYFNYDQNVGDLLTEGDRDSLFYTNVRLAIMRGTVFSRTVNEGVFAGTKVAPTDSAFSTNAVLNYNQRASRWGANFNYFQYFGPLTPYGVLNESDSISCSNGRVMKVRDWKINELETFNQWIIIEAEASSSIKQISRYLPQSGDSANVADPMSRSVDNDKFKQKVWNERFVEFVPNSSTQQAVVTFNITNVLSNMGYDIYLVTAPALANDSNALSNVDKTLPTLLRCTLNYPDGTYKNGKANIASERIQSKIQASGTEMDYLLLAEDFKFPVATYGVKETVPLVTLDIQPNVTASQLRNKEYTRNMRIDCILLVPHGTLELAERDDLGPVVNMYVHGRYDNRPYKYYYKLR